MNVMRAILFSIAAGISCLAGTAAAENTNIVPATSAPARGGYALLGGDVNGKQLYIAFSATTGGDGVTIVLPVKIDGQTGPINVALGNGALSVTTLEGSVMTLLQGSVVAIDHTVTVTGTVTLAPGSVVSIDHTVTVTGSVSLDPGTVVSIDHTVTVTGTVALAPGSAVSIDHTVTVTGSVALDPGQSISIDHTVTVTGSVALDPGQSISIDHTVTVTGSVALDPGQSISIDHTVTVTGTVNTQEVSNLKVLEFSFTPLTALYQAGDTFGPVTELTLAARISGGGFMIHSVSFIDTEGNNPDVTLVLSDQTFTVTGDGTPFDPDDTEALQFLGQIKIVGSDWEAYSVNGQASKGNLGQIGIVDATSLFVALVINTNTTYAGSQTFRGRIYLIQE